nr:type II secretion system protein GspK [uncultured Rhodopila sp.]
MNARSARAGQRGFALVIVLWSLGLLALLVSGLTAASRAQVGLARDVRGAAAAEAAADGAVQRAVFELRGGARAADAVPWRVRIGGAVVAVTIEDESGRINPNFSAPPLMASLLQASGLKPAQALDLARRIVDWRTATQWSIDGGLKLDRYRQAGLPYGPPGRPFLSVDEIGLVPGVTADLLERLQAYVSVYQSGDPQMAAGAGREAVQTAEMINHAPVLAGFTSQDRIVQIHAAATVPGGVRFVRAAVVRLRGQPQPGEAGWQILSWE